MAGASEIEFIFEPQEEGGYYVYAPDLPGLHTQGETLEEARASAERPSACTSRVFRKRVGRSGWA